MRTLILFTATLVAAVATALVARPAAAAWDDDDYRETRELTIAADGVDELTIRAGAGSMVLEGESGTDEIEVRATVIVAGVDDDDARRYIEEYMTLSLQREGERAALLADFRDGGSGWLGPKGAIALEIVLPRGVALDIDDGSGSIVISGTRASIRLEDGSGSVKISEAASVDIRDGAGSIRITDATGDVRIRDGAGSITVEGAGGDVQVEDGSGSIQVREVAGDFRVTDDGSGSVRFSDVRGRVDVPDR